MKKLVLAAVVLFFFVSGFSWAVLEDYSDVEYVYFKTTGLDDGSGIEEIIYGVKVEKTDTGYSIVNETMYDLPEDATIDQTIIFGQSTTLSFYTLFDFVSSMVLSQINFNDMVTTNLMMMGGKIKYEGQVTVQSKNKTYTGEKIVCYDDEDQIVKYWVLNEDIPFPLLNVSVEEGKEVIVTSLWDYKIR
ncbi:MAG: hypothetical protein PWQ77_1392 [Kosmotogales bacterium]|nr:hypothetical protein [Kosmotogales bacterium]